jgi:hypothetical protein
LVLLALFVSSCGVDGPPLPPEPKEEQPTRGISIEATVEMGIAGGS